MKSWVEREMVAEYLLDIGGAWRWVSGNTSTMSRIPAVLRAVPDRPVWPAPAELDHSEPPRLPSLPVQWIEQGPELASVCARLRSEEAVALDVETTLSRALCLVQLATREHIYVIDPLAIVDLAPLARLLRDPDVVKIIHNASFEKKTLERYGIEVANIADTLALSRARHGMGVEGGHSLAAVCRRELGVELDKSEQTSDWMRRPLSRRQLAYAALDVEVLFGLWDRLQQQTRLF